MKKTLLLLVAVGGFSLTGLAQSQNNPNNPGGSSGTACEETAVQNLRDCLDSKNVTYSLVPSMTTNELYLYVEGNPPPGKIISCMQQYNSSKNNCPSAPVIVESSTF